jgi:dynein heavy chain, axonemal
MARVCGDLLEVAVVLDQFHKFLGPELKAVTGESAGIDDIMEVTRTLHYTVKNKIVLSMLHDTVM